jgi:hypothetical protein
VDARIGAQHHRTAKREPPRARGPRREQRALPLLSAALRVPGAAALVERVDALVRESLYGEISSRTA